MSTLLFQSLAIARHEVRIEQRVDDLPDAMEVDRAGAHDDIDRLIGVLRRGDLIAPAAERSLCRVVEWHSFGLLGDAN